MRVWRIALCGSLCVLLTVPAQAALKSYVAEKPPKPKLIAPLSEEVDLTGKDALLFQWSTHEGSRGRRIAYDFRLYRGLRRSDDTIMIKEDLKAAVSEYSVPSDRFEDGEEYTWSLRQRYYTGKSDVVSYSFRVRKRGVMP